MNKMHIYLGFSYFMKEAFKSESAFKFYELYKVLFQIIIQPAALKERTMFY